MKSFTEWMEIINAVMAVICAVLSLAVWFSGDAASAAFWMAAAVFARMGANA